MLAHFVYLAAFIVAVALLVGACSLIVLGVDKIKSLWPTPKREVSARMAAQLLIAEEAGRAAKEAKASRETNNWEV